MWIAKFNKPYKEKIKKLTFDFHHIASSNSTFIDKEFEEKKKIFHDFKSYENFFQKVGITVDQNKRKKIIEREFEKILNKKLSEQVKPIWPSLLDWPIFIDKTLDEIVNNNDEYIFWAN